MILAFFNFGPDETKNLLIGELEKQMPSSEMTELCRVLLNDAKSWWGRFKTDLKPTIESYLNLSTFGELIEIGLGTWLSFSGLICISTLRFFSGKIVTE